MSRKDKAPLVAAIAALEAAAASGIRGANLEAVNAALEQLTGGRDRDLTDLHYRNLKPGQRRFDRKRPGLIARRGSSETVWIYRTRLPGEVKQMEIRFGTYPETTLAEAREIWEMLRAQRRRGQVPKLRQAESEITIAELVDRYLIDYADRAKRASSAAEDRRLLQRHLLPNFGNVRAIDFDHAQALAVLRPLKDRQAFREAQKVRAVISTMFSVATKGTRRADLGDVRWLPPTTMNPMAAVPVPGTSEPTHLPDKRELSAYMDALEHRAGESAADALMLQALTVCRIAEPCGASWAEIDLGAGVWTLPAARAKNGEAHRVLLSSHATRLLQRRRDASPASRWVFPAPSDPSKPISPAMAQRLVAALRPLGLHERFTSHSLRVAALTWIEESGGGKDIRDRVSNHVDRRGVDARYARASHDRAARDWWQRWGDHLVGLAGGDVIEIEIERFA